MEIALNFSTILNGAAVAGIGYIGKTLYDIREHLATLNGRMGRIETWRDDHEKHSAEIIDGVREAESECKANMRRELDSLSSRLGGGKG